MPASVLASLPAMALLLFGVAYTLLRILDINAGVFAYTLDDPYIHLALADNLWRGHYGVNAGEFSSPSSSILWPFLLAPFAARALGEYIPLLLNVLLSLATLALVARLAVRHFAALDLRHSEGVAAAFVAFFVIATNMIGLVFNGMEHSAHVLSVAAVVAGLDELRTRGRIRALLVAGIVLGPLIRYEGLVISAAALAIVFVDGRRLPAVMLGVIVAATLGGFSLFLMALELAPLPNSVLAKSIAADGGLLQQLFAQPERNKYVMRLLVLTLLVLAALAARRRQWLPLLLAAPVLVHLAVGRFGWYHRYEMYVIAWSLLALLINAAAMRDLCGRRPSVRVAFVMVLLIAGFGIGKLLGKALMTLPHAASNIAEQHFLMRDIARAHGGAVALNDIGVVAYRSPHYVLDLWGLASYEALQHRLRGDDIDWVQAAVEQHSVQLAMVYDNWFPEMPPSWRRVGELRLLHTLTSAGADRVTVYATQESAHEPVRSLLLDMQQRYSRQIVLDSY